MSAKLEKVTDYKCFDGTQSRFSHTSLVLNCKMHFSIFLPSQSKHQRVPVLYWLSGLTCTDENFVQKAGAQRFAEKYGIAIVAPDTSPRGDSVPDDEQGAYDFGLGAGFYVNATQTPWAKYYNMYDYIRNELPELVNAHFPVVPERSSIFGHSMGGHGALTIALKNTDRFHSVSAFAPICSPMRCPWGEKALGNYLGQDRDKWREYDTTELIGESKCKLPILIDQGTVDDFLKQQLKPELLTQAAEKARYPIELRLQKGYDHSYFFIASFIEEHIQFHSKCLS